MTRPAYASQAPKLTERFYQNILDHLTAGVYFVDPDRRITYWSKGAEALSGYAADEVVGHSCRDNVLVHTDSDGCNLCVHGCPLLKTLGDQDDHQADVFMKHKQGHRVPVSVQVAPILSDTGEVLGAVEMFGDNSVTLAAIERAMELEREALIDPLTGVGNRRFTERVLREQHAQFQRDGKPYTVLFFDADHFKAINDTHGHDAGDAVLRAISKTLVNSLRSFDSLGRWGGEEFVGVLSQCEPDDSLAIANRCCVLVRNCAVKWGDAWIRPTISIGVALAKAGEPMEDVVKRADARVYEAKEAGRDRVAGP